MPGTGPKIAISSGAVAVIVARLIWPNLRIDAITLGLLLVALLPWLSGLIKSAEFPGGWKIEFRDVQSAGAKIIKQPDAAHLTADAAPADIPRPSYLDISNRDPNLALVGLRIEIEKHLRALARQYEIPETGSLIRLLEELRVRGVLNDRSVSGLKDLVMAGNQAAHGAEVDPSAAAWALEYGPQVLAILDAKLAR